MRTRGKVRFLCYHSYYISKVRKLILPLFALCGASASAQIADTLADRQIEGEAVVAVKRNRSLLKKSDVGTVKWDMKQLQYMPQILGDANPMRYAQLLPMVQTSNETDAGLHVQGCNNGQNAVLMGEAVVYNPAHLMGIFSTFNSLHFSTMEFTTLIRTDAPSRLGGLLKMHLPEAENRNTWRHSTWRGELEVGPLSSQGTVRIQPNEKLSIALSARQAYMNLLYGNWLKMDDNELKYNFGDYNATLHYRASDKHQFLANFYFGSDNIKYNAQEVGSDLSMNWRNLAGEATWVYTPRPGHELKQSVTLSSYRNSLNVTQGTTDASMPSRITTWNYLLRYATDRFNAGAQYQYHHTLPQSPRIDGSYSTNEEPQSYENAHEAAVFGEYLLLKPASRFNIQVGARATLYQAVEDNALFAFDPKVTFSYRISDSQKLSLQGAMRHQYLQQTGFTSTGFPIEFWFVSTSKRKAQSAESLSLLYETELFDGGYKLTAEGYYKWLHHQKETNGSMLDVLTSNYNLDESLLEGRGRNYGFGVQFIKQRGRVNGWLSYSWGRSLRTYNSLNLHGTFPSNYERKHEFNAVVNWHISPKWDVAATGIVASGTPFTMPEAFYLVNGYLVSQYGEHNACRLPLYKRVDLAVNYKLRRRTRCEQRLNFSLYNAFCCRNVLFYRLRLKESGFSMRAVSFLRYPLPSLSYSIKF